MKSIGVLKTCEFKSNAQNARALELMIPCHNNAATCYIKRKNYGDARLLSENVRGRKGSASEYTKIHAHETRTIKLVQRESRLKVLFSSRFEVPAANRLCPDHKSCTF